MPFCVWQGPLFLGCKSTCHKKKRFCTQEKLTKYHLACDPLGNAIGDGRPNHCDNSDGMYAKQVSILSLWGVIGITRRGGGSISLYYGVAVCTTEYQFVLLTISLYYGVPVCTTEYQFVLRSISLYYGVSVCTTECPFVLRTTEYQFVLWSISLYYEVSVCTTEYQFALRSISMHYGVSV